MRITPDGPQDDDGKLKSYLDVTITLKAKIWTQDLKALWQDHNFEDLPDDPTDEEGFLHYMRDFYYKLGRTFNTHALLTEWFIEGEELDPNRAQYDVEFRSE